VSRELTSEQKTQIYEKFGTQPVFIVEVDWGSPLGPTKYTDANWHPQASEWIEGKILSVSGLDAVLKLGSTGTSANISIVLDDTTNEIHSVFSVTDVQGVRCRVYQAYLDAINSQEKFLLFDGELASPFVWSERERTFKFDVVTVIDDREIGFSPEEGEFEFIADSAVGKAWPLCFGRPIRVPAVKITERVRGTSLTRYGAISQGDLNSLCSAAQAVDTAENEKRKADSNPGFSDENYAEVIDAINDAQISLNTAAEALIFDSPTQEDDINAYIQVCKDLAAEERLFEFWTAEALAAQTALDAAELGLEANAQAIEEAGNLSASEEALALLTLIPQKAALELEFLNAGIDFSTALVNLIATTQNIAILEAAKAVLERRLTQIVITEIVVDNGENFPQGETVAIIVNNLKFSGEFLGNVFTIGSVIPTETNVELTTRENGNANELWVEDPTIDISRKYCVIYGRGIIYIENQQGSRCQYSPILFKQIGTLGSIYGIEGDAATREVYDEQLIFGGDRIAATSAIIFDTWKQSFGGIPTFAWGLSKASDDDWNIEIGDEVFLDADYTDLYIANLIPSTEIKEVFARRTVNGVEQLLPVPSSRYTVTLSEEIAGQNATTIRFDRPLSQYVGEDWSDDVFITLISSVGPNTSDIIKYLIQTYTDLSVDTTSFDAVESAISLYPSDFALLERVDALATIEEIAWQARCAVIIKNGVVFLKYLAVEEIPVITLSESDIDDLSITFSNSDALVTKFVAIWQRDLSEDEVDRVVLRNNVPKYGLLEQEFNFYIYNIKELVVKSATFWLIRMSNTWKVLTFVAYLDTLELESFDTVAMSLPIGLIAVDKDVPATDPVETLCIVQQADYNSAAHEIQYEVLTPILSGDKDPHLLFWPASAVPGTSYPTDKDLFAGGG